MTWPGGRAVKRRLNYWDMKCYWNWNGRHHHIPQCFHRLNWWNLWMAYAIQTTKERSTLSQKGWLHHLSTNKTEFLQIEMEKKMPWWEGGFRETPRKRGFSVWILWVEPREFLGAQNAIPSSWLQVHARLPLTRGWFCWPLSKLASIGKAVLWSPLTQRTTEQIHILINTTETG